MPLWSAPAEVRIPPVLALDTVLAGLRPDTERMSGLDSPTVSAGAQLVHAAHGDRQAERVGDHRGDAAPDLMQEDSTTEVEGSATLTVSDVARAWLARGRGRKGAWTRSTAERYGRVVRCHIEGSSHPALPPIGTIAVTNLTVDDVALWSAANEQALAPTTAKLTFIALGQVTRFAVRRGWLASDPVLRLEPGEKPNWKPGRVSALQGDDLARVLYHAGSHRPLFEVVAFTGMRISEALGMLWRDVDFDAGILHVEQQLTRYRTLGPLKTEASRREIELPPAVVRLLRERWLASPFKGPTDLVWCTPGGRGRDYRKVGQAFRDAVRSSGVTAGGRLSLHSLRHGYASMLIGRGLPLLFISRQLGHSKPSMTLNIYAHEFARRESGAAARQALETAYTEMQAAGRR